jgi:arginine/ornithine transport system substrate-binding protein
MKRIVLLVTMAIFVMAAGVQAKDWKNIRIGVEGAYPPFSSTTPEGKLVGFDIDIAYALCEYMGAQCKLIAQDWDGIIPALLTRKYDAIIASMSITDERKKKVNFSNKYYQTPAKFAVHKDFIVKVLKGKQWKKKIGVQRATIHDKFATDNFGDNVEILRYGTQDEAYLDMKAGRLDLILADSIAVSDGFLKQKGNEDYQFIGPDFTDPKWFGIGAGIAMRKQDTDLAAKFNAAIDGIRANGTYKKIQDKYFNFNVYGE